MTFIVTYTQGHLGCFTLEEGGWLSQHALIDIGETEQTPQQLVKIALDLAKTYGWNGQAPKQAVAPARKQRVSAARKQVVAKARRQTRKGSSGVSQGLQPNEPLPEDRQSAILAYLADHPDSPMRDIVTGLGLVIDSRILGRWNHYMQRIVNDRIATVNKDAKPFTYRVIGKARA